VTSPLFIVFEGIDGAGKSSQLSRLAERFEAIGRTVVRTVEPTSGPHGTEIRRRAREGPALSPREELDMFLVDRRENVEQNVQPALEAGSVVLQDRYYFSTAAYQAARPALELTSADVLDMHDWAPSPDLVVLLDLDVGEGLSRVRGRGAGDAFEQEALQRAVRANFLAMAERDASFARVDASLSPDHVAAAIWERVAPLLGESL
jgi:dTMP kinase